MVRTLFTFLIALLAASSAQAASGKTARRAVTPAQLCERADGNAVGSRCFCEARRQFFDPADAAAAAECKSAGEKALVGMLSSAQKKVEMSNCSNCNPDQDERIGCPQALIQAGMRDDSRSLWGALGALSTPNANCPLPQSASTSPEALERLFAGDPKYSVGNPPPFMITSRDCLGGAVKSLMSRQPFSPDEKKRVVSEYYHAMKRLNDGELVTLESIGSIDGILWGDKKEPAFKGIDCARQGANADLWCRKISQCMPRSQSEWSWRYNKMISMTELALRARSESEKKLIALRLAKGGVRRDGTERPYNGPDTPEMAAERENIKMAETLAPWIRGAEFKRIYRNNPGDRMNITGAFNQQMKLNRDELVGKLRKISAARACLNHPSKLRCPEASGILSEIPFVPAQDSAPVLQSYINDTRCRLDTRAANDGISREIDSYVLTGGLTIATLGVGSAAAGARAAFLTGQRVGQGAKLAWTAMIGMDVANAGLAAARVNEVCGSLQLDGGGGPGVGPDYERGPSCAPEYSGPNAKNDPQACAAAVLTDLAPNLIPFVPMVMTVAKMNAIARQAKNFEAFKTSFRRLGGDPDDILVLAAASSKESQGKLAQLIATLDTDDKIRAFKAELERRLKAKGFGKASQVCSL